MPAAATPAHGNFVFCLGWDALNPMPEFILEPGDMIAIEQDVVISSVWDYIVLMWKMRTPANMPVARTLVAAGNASFRETQLIGTGSTMRGIYFPATLLLPTESEQIFEVSGTISNNGLKRCSAVLGTAYGQPLHYALLEDTVVTEVCIAATIKVLGARWVARAYLVSDPLGTPSPVLRAELIEPARHEVTRQLQLHCSQAGATTQRLRFELGLASVTP